MSARHLEAAEAEMSVLGGIMLDNTALDRVASTVAAEHFHAPRHAVVFGAMLKLAEVGDPIDPITLVQHLEQAGEIESAGGLDYVLGLAEASATAVNIEHHARIVRDAADVRAMTRACHRIAVDATSGNYDSAAEFIDEAQAAVFAVSADRGGRSGSSLRTVLPGVIERIRAAHENPGIVTGTPSGFADIDALTSGFQPGRVYVVAGRPGMGKSALANGFITAAAKAGGQVALFSLEMQESECASRLLHAEAKVNERSTASGHITGGDIDRLLQAVKALNDWHVHIDDDSAATVMKIRSEARKLAADKSRPPLSLVVVDYLQLMSGDGQSREQVVANISRGLKVLAGVLGVPVILLSQLNRGCESRPDKRPLLSDLRESGAIEQDADVVMFVYRDEVYNPDTEDVGIAEVIIRKNRGGPTGVAKLRWFAQWTRFESLARER